MKLLALLLLFSFNAHATKLFIEPGVFMNMMDSSTAEFEDGSNHYKGTVRNKDLSYAVKFGLHFGHYEFGIETEVYNYVAHLESSSGSFTKDMQLTYNSIFFGYEFIPTHFLYLALSNTPYMSAGGKSYLNTIMFYPLNIPSILKNGLA